MDYLTATVMEIHGDYILAEDHDHTGYLLFTIAEDEYILNRQYKLFIHEEIKLENNSIYINRFAFLDPQVRRLFRFLMDQKGIGPKVAKGIIFSFGSSKQLIDALHRGREDEMVRLNKKYSETLMEAMQKPKNKNLMDELARGVRDKSIRSEVLWILMQMEYEREKCLEVIDSVHRRLVEEGSAGGIEELGAAEAVKECIGLLFGN